jgi:guanosine-3',5'-bis(diphosphate) 3'-pyrophosphohydrolase
MPETNQNAIEGTHRILQAAKFAADRHAHQKRKGAVGEPYIGHLLEVADLIANASETLDVNLIVAALLHDTVEDTSTTPEELRDQFGEDAANLVAEVTDDKTLPKATRKALQIEKAPHKSLRATTIKLADKISNLRAILASPPTDWSLERQQQYFQWAKRVVDGLPLANAKLKAEFERTYARFDELARET